MLSRAIIYKEAFKHLAEANTIVLKFGSVMLIGQPIWTWALMGMGVNGQVP